MKDPQCVSNCTSEGPWEGLGLEGLGTEVPLKDTDLVLFPWGKARGPPGLWRGFRQDGGWGERTPTQSQACHSESEKEETGKTTTNIWE